MMENVPRKCNLHVVREIVRTIISTRMIFRSLGESTISTISESRYYSYLKMPAHESIDNCPAFSIVLS